MHRLISTSLLLVAGGCAATSPGAPEPSAPGMAQISGLALPERVADFQLRMAGSLPDGVIEFNYFAPSPRGPTVSVRFPPPPDGLDVSVLREAVEAHVSAFLSSRIGQGRGQASAVEPFQVTGTDRQVYDGWCASMWHEGSRLLQWICYFEKQERLVMLYILDDNFSPSVTPSFVREFLSGALGGLVIASAPSF